MTAPCRSVRGLIFNVQHYSIHDGPGIRTTVFLSGCPLRCLWCQNPEATLHRPQLLFDVERCKGCGRCVEACPNRAVTLSNGVSSTDRELCYGRGACVEACPSGVRTLAGRHATAGEVFDDVAGDAMFYETSGGGVTLSGGEPLAQPEFSKSLLALCKEAGLHTAIDTCGYAKWETVADVVTGVDLVLYDFKHMDAGAHRKLTGVDNQLILENAKRIVRDLAVPMLARIPIIPGCNDSTQNLTDTARFLAEEIGCATPVHLIPYHNFGTAKWHLLGKEPIACQPPSDERIAEITALFRTHGLTVRVGG